MATINSDELKKYLEDILGQVALIKNITQYEVTPDISGDSGDGFMSEFFTGRVKNTDTGEVTNVAIKKAPASTFEYTWTLYNNEAIFYSSIYPTLDSLQRSSGILHLFDNVPTFFCAGRDPKKEFIALENLKPFGYIMFDKKNYLDKEHLELIFKTYGKFHALSFVLRKQNIEKYQEIHAGLSDFYPRLVDLIGGTIQKALQGAVDSLDSSSEVYEQLKDIAKNSEQMFIDAATYKGEYRCSTHGDCWSNNMLFKYDESGKLVDMKLIDFQIARDGTPIHDLSYFFYSGASKTEMDNLEYYLRIYHNSFSEFTSSLGEEPNEVFPLDVLLKEWKENALLGLLMGIYVWQIKLVPKEAIKKFLADYDVSKMNEETLKILRDEMYKSEEFVKRTTPLLIHGYEYGII